MVEEALGTAMAATLLRAPRGGRTALRGVPGRPLSSALQRRDREQAGVVALYRSLADAS